MIQFLYDGLYGGRVRLLTPLFQINHHKSVGPQVLGISRKYWGINNMMILPVLTNNHSRILVVLVAALKRDGFIPLTNEPAGNDHSLSTNCHISYGSLCSHFI